MKPHLIKTEDQKEAFSYLCRVCYYFATDTDSVIIETELHELIEQGYTVLIHDMLTNNEIADIVFDEMGYGEKFQYDQSISILRKIFADKNPLPIWPKS